jgi:hypothetical protein
MTRPDAGMALAVVLLLLLGLTVVALAGFSGAVTDLAVVAAGERAALAMEAAETAVTRTLGSGRPIPAGTVAWPGLFADVTVSSEIRFDPPDPDQPLQQPLPVADGSVVWVARHFTIRARALAGHGAAATLEQGFQSLWPPEDAACGMQGCPPWPVGVFTDATTAVDLGTDPTRTSWRALDTTAD